MKNNKKSIFDKKLLFYCSVLFLPLLQYVIFYICVNFNSFILAFSKYDMATGKSSFAGFENFKTVFNLMFGEEYSQIYAIRFKNSLFLYLANIIVGTGFALIFSYYIYKKQFASELFKIVLFLPSVIPGIALISIYRYSVDTSIINICNQLFGTELNSLIKNPDTVYGTVLFYNLFFGFGTQVMMYLGAMNKINPSITDACKLDGASYLREFISITVPCIFSIVTTFVVVGLTGLFAAEMGLYSFFAASAPTEVQTMGYYLYRETQVNSANRVEWPRIATFGLIFTIVLTPITISLRRFFDKIDPMR